MRESEALVAQAFIVSGFTDQCNAIFEKKIKFHRSAFVIFIGFFFNPYKVIKLSRTRTNGYFTRVLIQY